jgi:phage-related protein (TIGR01555 family)
MTNEERNARRREQYAAKKQARTDAQRGANALRNVQHMDGFVSTTTGAGITGVDKFTSYSFEGRADLTDEILECLYLDNDIAATVVERAPKDALRGGYELMWEGASDQERNDVVEWAESEFNVTGVALRARIYSRLFGGGGVMQGSNGELEVERSEDAPVEFIRALASKDLIAAAWNADIGDQDYSTVEIYDYNTPSFKGIVNGKETTLGGARVQIHSSYILPFYGILTTDDRFRETGWGDSVLRRVYDALKQFEAAYQSVMHTLAENSIPVYKVEGLLNMLASENADLLQARFQLINVGKSNYRAIVLGENEEFLRVNAPLQEASNVVLAAMQRVAGAAGMPMTILWGMSPAGMNATGQSDLEIWNQQVAKEQSLVLGPVLLDLYRSLMAHPDSPVKTPEDLSISFPSLWTPSLQDEVNQYAQIAGADMAYVSGGVLKPEEVALKRAAEGGKFPAIDTTGREEALEMDVEALFAEAQASVQAGEPTEAPGGPAEAAGQSGPSNTPEGFAAGEEPQKQALNGAQVTALQGMVVAVAAGELPRETAIELMVTAFPIDRAQATQILAAIEEPTEEEKAAKAAPAPAPFEPEEK